MTANVDIRDDDFSRFYKKVVCGVCDEAEVVIISNKPNSRFLNISAGIIISNFANSFKQINLINTKFEIANSSPTFAPLKVPGHKPGLKGNTV